MIGSDGGELEQSVIEHPHVVWIGCGDMCSKSSVALAQLNERLGVPLTFIDILDKEDVKQSPLPGSSFFNISLPDQRTALHKHLLAYPVSHMFVANLPPQHLMTAFLLAGKCPEAQIIIAKPLDVNFQLIETITSGLVWPGITDRIFVHDHYLTKGAVEPIYARFPGLINTYGRIMRFEFYLVEHQTVEEEKRLQALNEGVISDLASHLFALAQLFFLYGDKPAWQEPGTHVIEATLFINHVVRARYTRCRIPNQNAETFAAIEVTLVAKLQDVLSGDVYEVTIPGIMMVGKGIKPTSSITAGLKGMRFHFELGQRSINLARGEVNPPLSDLDYADDLWRETGFNRPLVTALSTYNVATPVTDRVKIAPVIPFKISAQNAGFLKDAIRKASPLEHYRSGDTLDQVMGLFVANGTLDPLWLPKNLSEIGFG